MKLILITFYVFYEINQNDADTAYYEVFGVGDQAKNEQTQSRCVIIINFIRSLPATGRSPHPATDYRQARWPSSIR